MARPEHKPSATTRRKVAIAAGAGMAHEEIAIGLGITRPTLSKHYSKELTQGAYGKRLEVLDAMHRMAKKGNVAAGKAYIALTPAIAAPPLPKEEPKGKKEQANEDAKTAQAGTGWSDLLPANVVAIR